MGVLWGILGLRYFYALFLQELRGLRGTDLQSSALGVHGLSSVSN